MSDTPPNVPDLLRPLLSLASWQVVAGGSAGSLFTLDMGEKIPSPRYFEDREPAYAFQGEWYLHVECVWRLDEATPAHSWVPCTDPVTSWQESNEEGGPMLRGLHGLIGDKINFLSITPPAGDLKIGFESGRQLAAFCDMTWEGTWGGEGDGLSSNWSIRTPDRRVLCVGPGYRWIYVDTLFPLRELSPLDPLWQSTLDLRCSIP